MGDADSLTIAIMFGALVALGALVYLTWAVVVFLREQTRVGVFTLRWNLIQYGALTAADDPQSPAVRDLLATWRRIIRSASRWGLWGAGLATGFYLAVIAISALMTRQPIADALFAGAGPSALLAGIIGIHIAYLRELLRLPPDATAQPLTTPTRPAHPLIAWGYRLLPLGLFLCILALSLYVLLATPTTLVSWDAARVQANSGMIVFVLGTLLVALAVCAYLDARLRAVGPRQFAPDPALSRRADAALRRFIASQQDLVLLGILACGSGAFIILVDPGDLLMFALLALIALAFWLRSMGCKALAVM